MDLDEQIADMETITEPTTVTEWISLDSRYAILASLRELKRLREAVDNLADAYANKGPIVAAQAYSVLMEIRAIDRLKESPDGQ